ncbi:MAG: HupE/UreJ family protein [Phormidesmis sp.]
MTQNLSIRKMAGGVAALLVLFGAAPALAHHPFGGQAPQTIFQGLVSGLGHPVLGLDHFAFVVTIGLLAAVVRRGFTIPLSFLLAALVGTGLHLAGLNLPALELVISASVLTFGVLATVGRQLSTSVVVALAAIAGVFHGYAYGEAVIGSEPTPLVAYLIGFSLVQGAIAFTVYLLSKRAVDTDQTAGLISVRSAGFVACGAGAAFLGNLLV